MLLYKVIVILKEEGRKEGLDEACRSLISRVKELISDGVHPKFLDDSCMLETEIDGVIISLRVPIVIEMAKKIGILNPDSSFSKNFHWNISDELEKEGILEAYIDSISSYPSHK